MKTVTLQLFNRGRWWDAAEPCALLTYLRNLALPLIELPNLLKLLNCPDEILNFPGIGFEHIEQKLISYGVYHV